MGHRGMSLFLVVMSMSAHETVQSRQVIQFDGTSRKKVLDIGENKC